jgi:hypothetical protein
MTISGFSNVTLCLGMYCYRRLGGTTGFRNVCNCSLNDPAKHPRRLNIQQYLCENLKSRHTRDLRLSLPSLWKLLCRCVVWLETYQRLIGPRCVKLEAGLLTETSANFYNISLAIFHKTLVFSGLTIGKNSIIETYLLKGGGRIIRPKRREISTRLYGVVFQETFFSGLIIGRNSGIEPNSFWLQWGPTVSSYLFFLHTPPHLRINLQGMFCSQYSIDRPLSTPLLFLLSPLQLTLVPRRTKYNTSFFIFHEIGFGFYCFACVQLMRVCSSTDKLQDSFTLRRKVVNTCTAWHKIQKLNIFTTWCIYVSINSDFFPYTVLTDCCVDKWDTHKIE